MRLCGPEALTAGQVIPWIYRAIVDPNFVMQVRGGTAARSPNVTNHVILPDPLPGFHGKLGEVAKPCRETITVIDDNQIPVRGLPLCVDDFAIGGGTGPGSKQRTDIDTPMNFSFPLLKGSHISVLALWGFPFLPRCGGVSAQSCLF